jgi:hypothetical protein
MPRLSLRPQLATARTSLRRLQRALDRLAAKATHLERAAATNGSPRRKLTLTPERRAQLKLQGQYMGYMRQLKPAQKKQVKAAKEKGGYGAGISLAKRLANR